MEKTMWLFAFFVTLAVTVAGAKKAPLRTVPKVDLERYAGRWYEMARFPNRFQKECAGDVTANYARPPGGKIEVVNRCRKSDGKTDEAKGVARVVDRDTNAKLEVRFAPGILSFLPFVWGDYWVIGLGENYEYAVVGSPSREYLWFLSREPQMDENLYRKLLGEVSAQGFDANRLVRTSQTTGGK
jgi:apolipoprotein D and lipocalin family protein